MMLLLGKLFFSESDLLNFGILVPFGTSPKADDEKNVKGIERLTTSDVPLLNALSGNRVSSVFKHVISG